MLLQLCAMERLGRQDIEEKRADFKLICNPELGGSAWNRAQSMIGLNLATWPGLAG